MKRLLANNIWVLFLFALIAMAGILWWQVRSKPVDGLRDGIVIEAFGFLGDIILFGLILSLYDKWRDRRRRIREYHELLEDFASWEGEEGVLTKVRTIRRLNRMGAPLPVSMFGIKLSGAELQGTDLRGTSLVSANFRSANLAAADLSDTCLTDAILEHTILGGAVLKRASLVRTNLTDAKLTGANLEKANLTEAKLNDARLFWTVLNGADLTDSQGLTLEQLAKASWDDKTVFPDYINRRALETVKAELEIQHEPDQ